MKKLRRLIISTINVALKKIDHKIGRINVHDNNYPDFEDHHTQILKKIQPYTMTSPERVFGLIEAIRYLEINNISGSIVECGVWKGGSMMAIIETLKLFSNNNRRLYLYDTFDGMSTPTSADLSFDGKDAKELLSGSDKNTQNYIWAYAPLTAVKDNLYSTGYPKELLHFVQGKVEDTIPAVIPEKIALLRLDTDWYESTKHELMHLFPLLCKGGILIIDDYGFWKGARKAVDEYFSQSGIQIFLARMDDTGRICVKQ